MFDLPGRHFQHGLSRCVTVLADEDDLAVIGQRQDGAGAEMPDRFARGRLLFAALAVVDGNGIDRNVEDPAFMISLRETSVSLLILT